MHFESLGKGSIGGGQNEATFPNLENHRKWSFIKEILLISEFPLFWALFLTFFNFLKMSPIFLKNIKNEVKNSKK